MDNEREPGNPPKAGRVDSSTRAAWRRLSFVVVSALATATAVGLLSRTAPVRPPVSFDRAPLQRLTRQKPDVILLGNSMVYTRFHANYLNELLAPTKVSLLAVGGSESAVWYAQLKYYIAPAKLKLRRVVLFFRDQELTLPRLRIEERNLAKSTPRPDAVIDRKTAPPSAGLVDHVRNALRAVAPVEKLREPATELLDDAALDVSRALAKGPQDERRRKAAINQVFRVEEQRGDIAEANSLRDGHDFAERFDDSFLPDIVALAKAERIPLTFVRVRRRSHAAGRPDPPELQRYNRELERYLAREGLPLVDLTHAEWEPLEFFGSGDHIDAKRRRAYTKRFVEHHRELFEAGP